MTTLQVSAAVLLTGGAALLATIGSAAAVRALFRDDLDRIGVMLLLLFAGWCGVFALGDLAASMPAPLLNLLLLGNPVVAVASAARIDIFHLPLLYERSPIAHRDFHYPAWPAAAALYGCAAIVTFMAARALTRRAAGINAPTH